MRLAIVLALPAFAPVALGNHTPIGACDSETSLFIEVGRGDPSATFYVVAVAILWGEWWVYQETNGIYVPNDETHSLQRGLDAAMVPVQGAYCIDDTLAIQDTRLV